MNKKNYRVLHLMTGFGGGISAFILNKAEELVNSDVEFNVVTFDEVSDRFDRAIHHTGGKIYKISDPEKHGMSKMMKEYNQVLKNFDKNVIVHSHFGMNLVVPFYFLTKLKGIRRFIIHAHTGAPYRLNDKKRILNRFFAKEKISAGVKCSENTFGIKSALNDPILHIPNSINLEKYSEPLQDKDELKINLFGEDSKNKKIIGHVGRFHHVKNHEFMIELIDELAKSNHEFLWVFVGDGELRGTVEQELKNRNLMNYVRFMGWQNDTSIFYKLFDIFVLPSFYEGLPTVAIESQAAGTPVILSDTITKEADLGLGLVRFFSLDDKQTWLSTIENPNFKEPSLDVITNVIVDKKFTNETSAQLYLDFIEGKIKSYVI